MLIHRIYQYIDFKHISINFFSNKVGMSNGYFAKQKKSNGSIGSQVIEKIVSEFPDLNLIWLITGEGEMLNTADSSNSKKIVSKSEYGIPLVPIEAIAGKGIG